MKCQLCATLLLTSLAACPTQAATAPCPPLSHNISSSNLWILLGGAAKGAVKQVIAGEFGKDVDSQKRVLGQFDRCGDLMVADISYDKREGNIVLSMEQHIARVQRGWVAEYAWRVTAIKAGREEVVDQRQGTLSWRKGPQGNIISATDKFVNRGSAGSATIAYHYDPRLRVQKSVTRGSDKESNGENRWRWNAQDRVVETQSARSREIWRYDKQWRELGLSGLATTPVSTLHSTDTCQLWDETGNCTLSFLHEKEVFARGTIERHLTSAYKYQYWDRSADER